MPLFLTEAGCQSRRRRVFNDTEADWALVTSPAALAHLAAFRASPFVFNAQNANAALLFGRDGTAVLFADNPQESFARSAFVTERVQPVWYECITAAPHRAELLWNAVTARVQALGPKFLAVEGTAVPIALQCALPTVAFQNIDAPLAKLRRRKDPDEVAQIEECLRIATAGIEAGRRQIEPGMTEVQACSIVQSACSRELTETALVYGDFASGPRTEQGGGPATSRVIGKGDLVLLDFSAVLCGYRGDFANTFVCGAKPTPEHSRWFDACLAAMHAGEAQLRPGVRARDVHAAVKSAFAKVGLADRFPHHAGHGIGVGHPESPFLVPESDEVLAEGDVVTLEPGLYAPGHGGMRFERNYVVTESGMRTISTHVLTLV